MLSTSDFDYPLPEDRIAQRPAPQRDGSRLMSFQRPSGTVGHHRFTDLPELLRAGDLLVLNDSRVIPARLRARKHGTHGELELLLVSENGENDWWTLLRPGKRVREGTEFTLLDSALATTCWSGRVLAKNREGHCRVQFAGPTNLREQLPALGEIPLPPYIHRAPGSREPEDLDRYQTVFARAPGSVAAPTAGLHFTDAMLRALDFAGIAHTFLTLHVGLGTFAPIKSERPEDHTMHAERFEIAPHALKLLRNTRARGGRVIAVGTTSLRVLETLARCPPSADLADPEQPVSFRGETRLFLHPPADFQGADGLITNFHLPASTLLMLVCAFARPGGLEGRRQILDAYAEAVNRDYRFYSYGDAMLIL